MQKRGACHQRCKMRQQSMIIVIIIVIITVIISIIVINLVVVSLASQLNSLSFKLQSWTYFVALPQSQVPGVEHWINFCSREILVMCILTNQGPVSRKPRKPFRARKAKAKSRTLRLQICFIHIYLVWREIHCMQEVSGVYTSLFLHSDERKMALLARKVSGGFEKRASGQGGSFIPKHRHPQGTLVDD